MRLLLVNPNMTTAMTDSMAALARKVAGDRAEIVPLTAPRGFPYIASRAEAQIAGAITLEMIADHQQGMDAVIIGAFGDPGLAGARDLFDLPVVGMAEAAVLSAAMMGERFSIVTFSPVMRRWYADCVAATGLSSRFTGVRTPETHQPDVGRARDLLRADLVALARRAVVEDGADVVILGGAPLAGLAPEIAGEVPALVLDPICAATAQALALASLRVGFGARACKPVGKPSVGLAPALGRVIAAG
ncbi:aspartate/glutamate racemase family protein [Salipiger marinus]|uniref:aspartate/glutamate racemase family protein n=1 Tax=Salipiger marinus TaxID=555512 RepID=UPI001E4F4CFF|nr:aspartate/glutamate racemase family protein [Salipiger manganoxidans]MCD1619877.1 aspartate/glutamate racemase family protein [Salipiger manganoxidans]MEB3418488.1 aspartate/glutamate racemase family protein [Salipiger manganoxidans]